MKVLVCGGRHFRRYEVVADTLDAVHLERSITEIISGGCTGADQYATEWAARNKVATRIFKADWARFDRAAGPIRNQLMLDEGEPHLVVAFPGGKGTEHMVRSALKAGVVVRRVR